MIHNMFRRLVFLNQYDIVRVLLVQGETERIVQWNLDPEKKDELGLVSRDDIARERRPAYSVEQLMLE